MHTAVDTARCQPLGIALTPRTRFVDPRAVDIWDSRFRWRSGDQLRDRTIDATWSRVATALTESANDEQAYWRSRYTLAFGQWQVLPDPTLLRFAGTDMPVALPREPSAMVNAGVFVIDPRTRHARFDHQRFSVAAALAVRILDDASITFLPDDDAPMRFGIGLIGLGDAIGSLGLRYDSPHSPVIAQDISRSLAMGCLLGSLQLVAERGNRRSSGHRSLADLWRHRELSQALAAAVARNHRHECLTRIACQPELACLANLASDSLEPAGDFAEASTDAQAMALQTARRAIHRAVQPWIDAPIDHSPQAADAAYTSI